MCILTKLYRNKNLLRYSIFFPYKFRYFFLRRFSSKRSVRRKGFFFKKKVFFKKKRFSLKKKRFSFRKKKFLKRLKKRILFLKRFGKSRKIKSFSKKWIFEGIFNELQCYQRIFAPRRRVASSSLRSDRALKFPVDFFYFFGRYIFNKPRINFLSYFYKLFYSEGTPYISLRYRQAKNQLDGFKRSYRQGGPKAPSVEFNRCKAQVKWALPFFKKYKMLVARRGCK